VHTTPSNDPVRASYDSTLGRKKERAEPNKQSQAKQQQRDTKPSKAKRRKAKQSTARKTKKKRTSSADQTLPVIRWFPL